MSKKPIIHNGVKVLANWPAKIASAQTLTHYTIAGQKLPRTRVGDYDPRWGQKPCFDCGVLRIQQAQQHYRDGQFKRGRESLRLAWQDLESGNRASKGV